MMAPPPAHDPVTTLLLYIVHIISMGVLCYLYLLCIIEIMISFCPWVFQVYLERSYLQFKKRTWFPSRLLA